MRVSKERFKEELESYRKRMQRERHMHSEELFNILKQEIHGDGVQEAGDLFLEPSITSSDPWTKSERLSKP